MDRVNKKEIVRSLLEDKPATRDNDRLLYMEVAKRLGIDNLATYDLLVELDYAAVIRARRLVQAGNESLRGNAYGKRQSYTKKRKEIYKPNYWEKMVNYFNSNKQKQKGLV